MRKTETREEKGGREENESFSLSLSLAFFPLFFDLVFFLLPSHEPAGSCSLEDRRARFPLFFPEEEREREGGKRERKENGFGETEGFSSSFLSSFFSFSFDDPPTPSPLNP